jgi:nicotinate-nucleotide adenylyltransferase
MIALFGGTFNPIHNGHIALAQEVASAFSLDRIEFLPSYRSVHRDQPQISAQQRQAMVELGISRFSNFSINCQEIERQGPSYTVDTLTIIKQQSPHQVTCWLMGADAFNGFLSWKKPQKILQLAHLIVCTRPGHHADQTIFPEHHLAAGESLEQFSAGKIVFHEMQANKCSSTQIRKQLMARDSRLGSSVPGCLDKHVLEYIKQHKLYE